MKYLYTVRQNDTLESVARAYGVSVREIVTYNRFKGGESLWEGMRLVVESGGGKRYIVRPYDTLESIAAKFGVSVESVMKRNNLREVFLGEVIYIDKDI